MINDYQYSESNISRKKIKMGKAVEQGNVQILSTNNSIHDHSSSNDPNFINASCRPIVHTNINQSKATQT